MSNLGLNCLHTAKIAIKGVQVHNVLLLDYVTLETEEYIDIGSSDPAQKSNWTTGLYIVLIYVLTLGI